VVVPAQGLQPTVGLLAADVAAGLQAQVDAALYTVDRRLCTPSRLSRFTAAHPLRVDIHAAYDDGVLRITHRVLPPGASLVLVGPGPALRRLIQLCRLPELPRLSIGTAAQAR
jgi:hypothetical protein